MARELEVTQWSICVFPSFEAYSSSATIIPTAINSEKI